MRLLQYDAQVEPLSQDAGFTPTEVPWWIGVGPDHTNRRYGLSAAMRAGSFFFVGEPADFAAVVTPELEKMRMTAMGMGL